MTLDYGRRLSRLRWRRRFPGWSCDDIAPDAQATRALSAANRWVLVRDETALPAPGPVPDGEAGHILLAARISPSSAPFVHTLRELEETPRPEGGEPLSGAQPPALSFSVADFPPREEETVAGYVRRLVSPPTPCAFVPGFAAVSFDEGPRGERPEVIRLLPTGVARLLDVGCASGEAGAAFRRTCPGVVVTGIEHERGAAEQARSRLDRVIEGEAIATLAELVRAGERFDAFLFADVLEHLEDPIGALVLARELASPGASLVASVPNVGHLSLVRDLLLGRFDPLPAGLADTGHLRWFTRASLEDALEEAGWRTVSIDAFDGAPSPDPEPFLDFVAWWPGVDPASLRAYQWLAVARPQ
ncbi:MAG: class I SAM-dependent methyltransferase [Acidobacteriota bacterium]|nr:class I SAM-dependent methyltransferase [Acidobacteriota bacterium]